MSTAPATTRRADTGSGSTPTRRTRMVLATAIGAPLLAGAASPVSTPAVPAPEERAPAATVAEAAPPIDRPIERAAATATSTVATTGSPDLEMIGLTAEQVVAVTRVAGLYEEAGLDLPPLVVRGSEDETDCSHHDGVHRNHGGWSEIVLCSDTIPGWERRVVGHELAHAWVGHNVSDEQREQFREIRGWTHWKDYDAAAWRDNGTEQAADVISWGVYDGPTALQIDVRSCDELHAAYTALTDLIAPQNDTSLCEPAEAVRF